LLTVAAAVALSALCLAASLSRLRGVARLAAEAPDNDELERRLQAKESALFVSLSRRNVRAFSRVALAGGTGFGVFELTGGGSQLPWAVSCFVAGVVGWGGCQEVWRRLGSKAGSQRKRYTAASRGDPEAP
jgi:hypothetical protein